MAGGPYVPVSVDYGTSGKIFPLRYVGAGGNAAAAEFIHGVVASLSGSDVTASLRIPLGPAVPSGTLKLLIELIANATSGTAKITVSDGIAGDTENPSGVTLTADTQQTITWSSGDNDKYKQAKVTLSATAAANKELVVAVAFNVTGWTLAATLGWRARAIFE